MKSGSWSIAMPRRRALRRSHVIHRMHHSTVPRRPDHSRAGANRPCGYKFAHVAFSFCEWHVPRGAAEAPRLFFYAILPTPHDSVAPYVSVGLQTCASHGCGEVLRSTQPTCGPRERLFPSVCFLTLSAEQSDAVRAWVATCPCAASPTSFPARRLSPFLLCHSASLPFTPIWRLTILGPTCSENPMPFGTRSCSTVYIHIFIDSIVYAGYPRFFIIHLASSIPPPQRGIYDRLASPSRVIHDLPSLQTWYLSRFCPRACGPFIAL